MNLFGDASVARRMALAFSLLLVLMIVMTLIGAWRLAALNDAVTHIVTKNLRGERLMGKWVAEIKANAVRSLVVARSDDAGLKQLLTPAMDATSKSVNDLSKSVEALLDSDEARRLFAAIGVKRKAYLDLRITLFELKKAGRVDEAIRLIDTSIIPAADAYLASVQALVDHTTDDAEKSAAAAAANAASGRNLLALVCVFGLLLGAVLSWRITTAVTGPIRRAVSVAQRVASGDLTGKIDVHSTDETGQLLRALQQMQDQLSVALRQIQDTSGAVNQAAREIAAGNTELSARTEEQASALEETAASMEQMTATVAQNAENAKRANTLATEASNVAVQGGAAVREVVDTMAGITQSSKKIADIIGVIDGITFQTNILALNAAVEAARAGEQGRGFAVVASEVRSLAQRSAAAAKEIKSLISDSVEKVGMGARQVDAAGEKLEASVGAVKRVTALIAEIAAASQEQSQGITQVSETVTQLEKVTQQNAAMVEQASAAASSLEEQAAQLDRVVSTFKVSGNARGGYSAPAGEPAVRAQAGAERTAPVSAQRIGQETSRKPEALQKRETKAQALPPASRAKRTVGNQAKSEGWEEF